MKNEAIKLSAPHSGGVKKIFSKYGLYFAFIALIIILAIASPTFFTSQNMLNVLRQYTTIGVIAVGMTFQSVQSLRLAPALLQAMRRHLPYSRFGLRY